MEPLDPFDELRALDPANAERLDAPELSTRAQQTLERILRSKQRRRSWTWPSSQRRRTYVIALAVSCIAAGSVTAVILTFAGPATQPRAVQCYERADLQAGVVRVHVHGSAVESCRRAWQQGQLGRLTPVGLQACKLPSGSAAVFPGRRDVCKKLHLRRLSGSGR